MATIEERVRAYSNPKLLPRRRSLISWEAATVRSGSGSAAEEKEYGADVMGVLSVALPDYKLSKGFLAQAKRAEPERPFRQYEWDRMVHQCERMLAITPDAFVIAYSRKRGVRFISAQAVRAFSGNDLFELYDIGVRTFFEKHLQSFIGDSRLHKPDVGILKRLATETPEHDQYVLHLRATGYL